MRRLKDIAKELGISKAYLSMMLSGRRKIPEHLKQPLCELVNKNQLQFVHGVQGVAGSNPVSPTFYIQFFLGQDFPQSRNH
jgi:transcriptional regulator with XRE-family HTH domain